MRILVRELLQHYCIPGEASEAFPSWEQLDDIVLWKIQNEVKSLQDKLHRLENEIAAARLNKEETCEF